MDSKPGHSRDVDGFSYRCLIFAFINNIRLEEHPTATQILSKRSVIVCEHPVDTEENTCEWNETHYHALVEHTKRFDNDRMFIALHKCCHIWKTTEAIAPVHFLAYLQVPPRKIVFKHYLPNSQLENFLNRVTPALIAEVAEKREQRQSRKRKNTNLDDILNIKKLIGNHHAQSESELVKNFDDPEFLEVFGKRSYGVNFKKALELEKQSGLKTRILTLSRQYVDKQDECCTPHLSAQLVEKWCAFQKIDPREFTKNVIEVMDRTHKKRNTLYLNGESNSGKTFLVQSLQKAAVYYGMVVQGTGGYAFMWQDCLNKRLIVINEPYFEAGMIESLKTVLEGTGCFVHKKNTGDEKLQPTPVVMSSNTYVWNNAPGSKTAIEARCLKIYDNLKACKFLSYITKDLHPQWLNILAAKFMTKEELSEHEGEAIDTDNNTIESSTQTEHQVPTSQEASTSTDNSNAFQDASTQTDIGFPNTKDSSSEQQNASSQTDIGFPNTTASSSEEQEPEPGNSGIFGDIDFQMLFDDAEIWTE